MRRHSSRSANVIGTTSARLTNFLDIDPIKMYDHPRIPSSYVINYAIPGNPWPFGTNAGRAIFPERTGDASSTYPLNMSSVSEVHFMKDCRNWAGSGWERPHVFPWH